MDPRSVPLLMAVPLEWHYPRKICSAILIAGNQESQSIRPREKKATELKYCPGYLKEKPRVHRLVFWFEMKISAPETMRK